MACENIKVYENSPSGYIPPSTITSISPSIWVVGHSYKVLVTGVFTGNTSSAISPGCDYSEAWVTKGDESSDPYVTISNYDEPSAFVSLTQMMFDVKVKDGASSGTYDFSMTCDGNCPLATAPIQIKGCADETITSVSPNIWFAGKAYKTTITGTNFITKEKATKLCPVSKVDATATSSNVSVSDVTVVSDTQITSTIKPEKDSPVEQGTVTVDSVPSNTTIIDNEVQWNNQGTLQNIAGIFATGAPQQAVVGQPIILTTNPNLPANITVTSSDWTVGGTRIAGYKANSESASVTELKDDDLKKPNITFYWVYPTDSTVTYNYCVNIPGLSADDIANKLNCSLTEKATFNVEGVTSPSIGYFNEFLAHINTLAACDGVGGGTYLVYGNVYGQPNPCPYNGTPGITFYPYGSPPNTGNMFFVQVVNSNDVKYLIGDVIKIACMDRPGLDGDYPYQGLNPTSVSDAPPQIIIPTYTTLTRTFSATMYLFWQSTSTAGSIPVPLAYIPWTFSADANLVGGTWTAGGGGAPVLNNSGQSNLSDPSQPNYGYPTWTGPAILKYKTK
jgi:hypothetical protein